MLIGKKNDYKIQTWNASILQIIIELNNTMQIGKNNDYRIPSWNASYCGR